MKDSFDDNLVNCFANIAVLNEKANRSFGAKAPSHYLKAHKVQPERLEEQAVPAGKYLEIDRFPEFIDLRAQKLAERATEYVSKLAG